MALQQEGVKSRSWMSWQIPIRTDAAHAKARIVDIETADMARAMAAGEVPIVPGFQGLSPEGRLTTLGRGGSDTSAVALAAALRPTAATSTPTSTASTRPIPGSSRRRARSTG